MSFERRKVRVGRVVSDKMNGTCVVVVEWRKSHRLYKKSVKMRTRFMVHDPQNECRLGDQVRITETRPLSKTKRWRVSEILQREDIAELQPDEIKVEDESVLSYQPQITVAVAEAPAVEEEEAEASADEAVDAKPATEVEEEPVAEVEAEAPVAEAEEPATEVEEEPVSEIEAEAPVAEAEEPATEVETETASDDKEKDQ